MSLIECISALQDGRTTSVEQVGLSLAAIERTRDTLNAFRTVCEERALDEAAEADRRLAAGERLPLLGVPVAVKDDVNVAGLPTAFGCAGPFPAETDDCEMVSRLRAAGAVIVGKTNSPEVGLYPFTEGHAFGVVRSPWSLHHTPGGSSGGAAAAVAAGIVPAAVGSDGAGSVRIPAAWCNLVGVKPQRGRIPTWPDANAFNGLTCLGPLTRTVADAALMLDVLSEGSGLAARSPQPTQAIQAQSQTIRTKRQPTRAQSYGEAVSRPPCALRIGISLRAPFSAARVRLDPEIRNATHRIAAALGELGHSIRPTEPRFGLMGLALVTRGEAGVHQWIAEHVPNRSELDMRTRETARVGSLLAKTALPLALRLEPRMRRRLGAVFDEVDVLIAPTSASPPLPVGATDGKSSWSTQQTIAAACPYAWPWNVLGWPAISVPAGLTHSGLPIGVQLLGAADSEPLLLSLAAQLEGVERWGERLAPHSAHQIVAGSCHADKALSA
jgi:amidase